MGSKWGSNEGIRIGDIFACWCGPYVDRPETNYYQVTALRGRTQVVLRPLRMVSSPVIKCKKTPRKKCSFVAEEAKKR